MMSYSPERRAPKSPLAMSANASHEIITQDEYQQLLTLFRVKAVNFTTNYRAQWRVRRPVEPLVYIDATQGCRMDYEWMLSELSCFLIAVINPTLSAGDTISSLPPP